MMPPLLLQPSSAVSPPDTFLLRRQSSRDLVPTLSLDRSELEHNGRMFEVCTFS